MNGLQILEKGKLTNNGTITSNFIANMGAFINNGRMEAGAVINDGTYSGTGEADTFFVTEEWAGSKNTLTYTVHGKAEYSEDIEPGTSVEEVSGQTADVIISVPKGASLVISERDILDLNRNGITPENISKYLKVSGTIENQGIVRLPEGSTAETIKSLNLTGGGIVSIGKDDSYKIYSNDGTPLTTIDPLDLTGSVINGNGVNWNADSNTLELEDVYIDGGIKLPDADTTIIINGHVKVDTSIYRDAGAVQVLTIKKGAEGATLSADIVTQGDVELNGITLFSNDIINGNTGGTDVLTIKDSTVEAGNLEWSADGGVNVVNSTLAAGTYGNGDCKFLTEKLVMDDASAINVIAPITNDGRFGLDEALGGIEKYLPEGYKLEKVGEWNTIVDSEGNPAYGFTLKVATTGDNPGQEDGNKPSGGNGQDNDGNGTNNGTNAGTTTTPKTGDYADVSMWLALILAAGFVTFMTVRATKREDR